jgi:hypothetical protein
MKLRVLPRFPANVLAGTGMSITKNGGTYIFATQAIVGLPVASLQDIPTDSFIGRDSVGTGSPEIVFPAGGLGFTGAGTLELTPNNRLRSLFFNITGAPISTGIKQDYISPFACTINKVTLLADQTGSIVVDIWKVPFASYPATVTNTITAGNKPTISASTKGQLLTLTGWTTSIAVGDCLRFNVDSTATLTRVAICLEVITV